MTAEESEIATRYAIRELNGFPDWLLDVAEADPHAVREVFSQQLAADFSAPIGENIHPDTLSSLRYGPEAIRTLCADTILENITRTETCNANVLSYALETLFLTNAGTHVHLASLAPQRVQDIVSTGDEGQLLIWLEAWLQVDAAPAIDFLEDFLADRGQTPDPFVRRLSAAFGERNWGGRDPGDADLFNPENLERLIPLVHSHIRFEDDPDHEGVYAVGEREHAQTFRDSLPNRLANQKGAEAQRVLRSLASDCDDLNLQAWLARLAEQQAALAVEYLPRSPSDVADFTANREMEPRTGNELYEIALDRLDDIKGNIETGDFSDRHLFRPRMPEKDIQRSLAGRLRLSSQGKYSVTREEEINLSQETDIRLHHPAAGCITIEIKPVESGTGRYSFNQLVAALREQLVGQYMRAAESSHGILVVAMLEARQWNSPDGGSRINFPEAIDRLNAIADGIVQIDSRVDGLRVVGIDFSET